MNKKMFLFSLTLFSFVATQVLPIDAEALETDIENTELIEVIETPGISQKSSPYSNFENKYIGSVLGGAVIGTVASLPLTMICNKVLSAISLENVLGLATQEAAIPVIFAITPFVAKVVVKKVWGNGLRSKLIKYTQDELDEQEIPHHKNVMKTSGRLAAWFFTLAI